jgi:hypothetical protein
VSREQSDQAHIPQRCFSEAILLLTIPMVSRAFGSAPAVTRSLTTAGPHWELIMERCKMVNPSAKGAAARLSTSSPGNS